MHRVSIFYPNVPDGTFDWDYYLHHHLPLAVGIARRHSGVTLCDVDKALSAAPDNPYRCICMVHFDGAGSMSDFCDLIDARKGNAGDVAAIGLDEPNFTDIRAHSYAVADLTNKDFAVSASHGGRMIRVKLIWPFTGSGHDSMELSELHGSLTWDAGDEGPVASELDISVGSIPRGGLPDYSAIWTLCFRRLEDFDGNSLTSGEGPLGEAGKKIANMIGSSPEVQLSERIEFDLARAC